MNKRKGYTDDEIKRLKEIKRERQSKNKEGKTVEKDRNSIMSFSFPRLINSLEVIYTQTIFFNLK